MRRAKQVAGVDGDPRVPRRDRGALEKPSADAPRSSAEPVAPSVWSSSRAIRHAQSVSRSPGRGDWRDDRVIREVWGRLDIERPLGCLQRRGPHSSSRGRPRTTHLGAVPSPVTLPPRPLQVSRGGSSAAVEPCAEYRVVPAVARPPQPPSFIAKGRRVDRLNYGVRGRRARHDVGLFARRYTSWRARRCCPDRSEPGTKAMLGGTRVCDRLGAVREIVKR